jgi:anti-anti-sigma factor
VTFEEDDFGLVVHVTGEVDVSNASDLSGAIRGRVTNEAIGVIIDLSEVTFIDSSGLEVLFDLARRLKGRRQQLRLVVPPESHIDAVIEIVDLRATVEVDDSLMVAKAELRDLMSAL